MVLFHKPVPFCSPAVRRLASQYSGRLLPDPEDSTVMAMLVPSTTLTEASTSSFMNSLVSTAKVCPAPTLIAFALAINRV